jgi:hypothetical protein
MVSVVIILLSYIFSFNSFRVPFSGVAFFPGRLIHTNELMVLNQCYILYPKKK